jgi:hypothetical protein
VEHSQGQPHPAGPQRRRITGYVFAIETGQPIHPDYVSRHFNRLVRQADQLKVDRSRTCSGRWAWHLAVSTAKTPGERVFDSQRKQDGTVANGIVDPHTWYRLFPNQPLRPYPYPGYLPPIRLHDLRHLAATLALTAGVEMKVVSETLRHKTLAITADTYTSVVPEVARAAATIVPRQIKPKIASGAASTSLASGSRNTTGRSPRRKNAQLRTGGAGGARTHDRRIMSPLL